MGETSLTADQLLELRHELERELQRLRRSMGTTGEAARPVELDQTTVGRLSRMDAIANQAMQKDLHAREQSLEVRLVEALRRLDAGTYGTCVACGADVPYGRLLVMPEARHCPACGHG